MDADKTIHIKIPEEAMQIIKDQAEILHKDPLDVLEIALEQYIREKAEERGMKVRFESVNTSRLS